MEKKQCEAIITFLNDSGRIVFKCERERGHKGKHQNSGITFNSEFVLTWETLDVVKEYMPSGVKEYMPSGVALGVA